MSSGKVTGPGHGQILGSNRPRLGQGPFSPRGFQGPSGGGNIGPFWAFPMGGPQGQLKEGGGRGIESSKRATKRTSRTCVFRPVPHSCDVPTGQKGGTMGIRLRPEKREYTMAASSPDPSSIAPTAASIPSPATAASIPVPGTPPAPPLLPPPGSSAALPGAALRQADAAADSTDGDTFCGGGDGATSMGGTLGPLAALAPTPVLPPAPGVRTLPASEVAMGE